MLKNLVYVDFKLKNNLKILFKLKMTQDSLKSLRTVFYTKIGNPVIF